MVVFLWWCFCGGVLVVVFLWWCFCGGVLGVVFLCFCDGVFVYFFPKAAGKGSFKKSAAIKDCH